MTDVKITGPDGGEVPLSGPARLRILEDGSATDHRLAVAEIVLAPRTDGPPLHRHAQHDEGFCEVLRSARPEERRPSGPPRRSEVGSWFVVERIERISADERHERQP